MSNFALLNCDLAGLCISCFLEYVVTKLYIMSNLFIAEALIFISFDHAMICSIVL